MQDFSGYIQRSNGLLKDVRLTVSNPFVKPVMQPAKNITLQDLEDLSKDYNRITSNAQYQYKAGRYILRTGDVATYTSLAQLFGLDSWIRSVFYARLVFHYSARLEPLSLQVWSAVGGRASRLPISQAPVGFSVGPAGVAVAQAPLPVRTMTLLPSGSTSVVAGDSIVYNFVLSTTSGYDVAQPVELFAYNDQVFESLVVMLAHDNCLAIAFNSVNYVVRLLDPTARTNVTVCAYHIKSVLPRVAIFINGLLHVDEFLSDTQRMQGLGGGTIQVFSNPAVGFRLAEVVAAELPSCESATDYAFFKTLAEASRLADFYESSPSAAVFEVDVPNARLIIPPTTAFTCNGEGFFYDSDKKIITLRDGTVWTSTTRLNENYYCLALALTPRLLVGPQSFSTSSQILWTVNNKLQIQILPQSGQMVLVILFANLALASHPIQSGTPIRLTVEIVKKSREPLNSLDSARLTVYLNETLVANLNSNAVSQELHDTNVRFGNSSNQLDLELSETALELVRSKQL